MSTLVADSHSTTGVCINNNCIGQRESRKPSMQETDRLSEAVAGFVRHRRDQDFQMYDPPDTHLSYQRAASTSSVSIANHGTEKAGLAEEFSYQCNMRSCVGFGSLQSDYGGNIKPDFPSRNTSPSTMNLKRSSVSELHGDFYNQSRSYYDDSMNIFTKTSEQASVGHCPLSSHPQAAANVTNGGGLAYTVGNLGALSASAYARNEHSIPTVCEVSESQPGASASESDVQTFEDHSGRVVAAELSRNISTSSSPKKHGSSNMQPSGFNVMQTASMELEVHRHEEVTDLLNDKPDGSMEPNGRKVSPAPKAGGSYGADFHSDFWTFRKEAQEGNLADSQVRETDNSLQRFLPSNQNEDVELSEEEFNMQGPLFGSDEFRMYEFKVRLCMRERGHDWTECPFAHPGEKARRRDPRLYRYSAVPCPDYRKAVCKRGDSCELSHGVFECWLHPTRYRTQICKDGKLCKRKVCFFAHCPSQFRGISSGEFSTAQMQDMSHQSRSYAQNINIPSSQSYNYASQLRLLQHLPFYYNALKQDLSRSYISGPGPDLSPTMDNLISDYLKHHYISGVGPVSALGMSKFDSVPFGFSALTYGLPRSAHAASIDHPDRDYTTMASSLFPSRCDFSRNPGFLRPATSPEYFCCNSRSTMNCAGNVADSGNLQSSKSSCGVSHSLCCQENEVGSRLTASQGSSTDGTADAVGSLTSNSVSGCNGFLPMRGRSQHIGFPSCSLQQSNFPHRPTDLKYDSSPLMSNFNLNLHSRGTTGPPSVYAVSQAHRFSAQNQLQEYTVESSTKVPQQEKYEHQDLLHIVSQGSPLSALTPLSAVASIHLDSTAKYLKELEQFKRHVGGLESQETVAELMESIQELESRSARAEKNPMVMKEAHRQSGILCDSSGTHSENHQANPWDLAVVHQSSSPAYQIDGAGIRKGIRNCAEVPQHDLSFMSTEHKENCDIRWIEDLI
ncbi:hypothetical protein KP509_33G046500 [Ceratopteris richardii]|uniref:C3H1-type domain-containing protein n=1 Tax=Ceratopteris richardii TaxID=49495 RepID=A0A8T2QNN2_CERRI|nr:hypothetical protein KP509_33G046500 [Ceratopteris richardii]